MSSLACVEDKKGGKRIRNDFEHHIEEDMPHILQVSCLNL